MNYVTVYEIINDSMNPYLIIPFFITLATFILLITSLIRGKTLKLNPGQIVGIVFFLLLLALSIYNVFKIKQYLSVIDDYNNNDYLIVEGIVEEFDGLSEDKQQETFKVNGVEFAVPNNFGYSLTAIQDSYIKMDGQKVRIGYMRIDEINYIVKLEIIAD